MNSTQSPVSPVELQQLRPSPSPTAAPQTSSAPATAPSSAAQKESWLPFTLHWYYLVAPITLSLCFGSVLVYLTVYSNRNHGLGADNGSSAILFGWRFTPTLIAVLYAQMTVILFEDVKRTEPFARLAKAPVDGATAYGTLLQTPRAWWSIFIDVCFRRKRMGQTSWSLVFAALINVIALLVISPLSSALLTSDEVVVLKSVDFTRVVPKLNAQIPMVPTRETYFRTMNALMRNVSTSAWLTDTTLAFPFWPTSELAQFGPNLQSAYGAWNMETTTLQSKYECEEMKLESADLSLKPFSGVYTTQRYGPLNGTQPMVTFLLTSNKGCNYELTIHPAADLAAGGGVTWSNATTFFPASLTTLPIGGRPYVGGVSPTHIYARVNASDKCHGHDILIMNTAWTAPLNRPPSANPMIPTNQTYERSPDFQMRGILCQSEYLMANRSLKATMSASSQQVDDASFDTQTEYLKVPEDFINIPGFETRSMQDDWETYVDEKSMLRVQTEPGSGTFTGFSGMAPLLAAPFNYNLTAMLQDPSIMQKAAATKGRFFMETVKEAFDNRDLMDLANTRGQATMTENRVVVLTEIGTTLAVLFFLSGILLSLVFWTSRLTLRPLNLRSDPASTIGLGLLLSRRLGGLSAIKGMHNTPRTDLYTALQADKYFTCDNTLLTGNKSTDPPIKMRVSPNWRPRVIRVRMLLALGLLLAAVLVAILTLNIFSARSQLSQLAFIYEADVSKFKLSFSTFAPISIAPTLTSIILGLWWDQLDITWRILQPFISMSRGPIPIREGAGLTYRSKTWVGAAWKSGHQKHWILFLVTVGSVMAQVLTVSMSALFERRSHVVAQPVKLQRNLEIRQVPLINEVDVGRGVYSDPGILVLDELYLDPSKNWLYGAGVQHSFNGSELPWTFDGWSLLPVDMSSISGSSANPFSSGGRSNDGEFSTTNASMQVPAIRARLECAVIEELANISSWVTLENLSNQSHKFDPDDFSRINGSGNVELYSMPDYLFAGSESHTTLMSSFKSVGCCQNGTIENPQRAVLGYWSPVLPPEYSREDGVYPYDTLNWPMSMTSKWVVGRPIVIDTKGYGGSVYFNEIPRIQAARCTPIIETAEASIVVDTHTGHVHKSSIDGATTSATGAWSDVFTRHADPGSPYNGTYSSRKQNITTSFGIMFVDALLGLADRRHTSGISYTEPVNENAFVYRDKKRGFNMDLMTHSMFTLADKDPEALLNYTTLTKHADRTFQTFFQHFVNSGLSLNKGGYAFQPINDDSMSSIGRPVDANGTYIDEKTYTKLNSDRTLEATVSKRIRVLHMNTVATYLSTAILIWLIFTTLVIVCLQRQYTRFLNRDVHLIADMLLLVAGSDNLLDIIEEQGVKLKRNKDIKTMLGWFKDRDGQVRWGIEVVGGRRAVEWVDAPKQGFHVSTGAKASSFNWRPWKTK